MNFQGGKKLIDFFFILSPFFQTIFFRAGLTADGDCLRTS